MPRRRTPPLSLEAASTVLDSVADGVFTVDADWRITYFNRAAEEITGVPRDEALGQACCDVFRSSICQGACALRATLADGRPIVNKAIYIVNANGERVPISISTAVLQDRHGVTIGGVETFRDLRQFALAQDRGERFADIISRNEQMRRLFDILPAVAESESTVLIEGESGTGKELVARAVHALSPRRDHPLIAVNCGALPDALLASELFGHVPGAFTDARKPRQGRFAQAEGGMLFLDEVGDISPALQVSLLRVLQERTFQPLGSDKPQAADVRVVAATNRDLSERVRAGAFRQDLYYRINVVRLKLPPLRERREDIPLLVDHFVQRLNRLQGRDIMGVSPEVMRVLSHHEFPGNIRELENIIEHAFVLCRGDRVEVEHLPDDLLLPHSDVPPSADRLEHAEAHVILDALRDNAWHRGGTARALGMHPTTLWRKMRRLGIAPPPTDGRTRR